LPCSAAAADFLFVTLKISATAHYDLGSGCELGTLESRPPLGAHFHRLNPPLSCNRDAFYKWYWSMCPTSTAVLSVPLFACRHHYC